MTHPLIGQPVYAALHFHVGESMRTRFVRGVLSGIDEDIDVSKDGEPERLMTLGHVTGIDAEDYAATEACVPLHDIHPLGAMPGINN